MSATAFENLVFDLAILSGLRNAVWRTPGADGGRDIEGVHIEIDMSGHLAATSWYVECKRLSRSIDWATVWQKIAFADSNRTDYLLIATTAPLSPACKSEVSKWNDSCRRPAVRFWDSTHLARIVDSHPSLLVKHGLSTDKRVVASAFTSLARQVSKFTQAAYGYSCVAEAAMQTSTREIEAAAALSELLLVRLAEIEDSTESPAPPFEIPSDKYDWLNISGSVNAILRFDRHGLRAVLATLRHTCELDHVSLKISDDYAEVAMDWDGASDSRRQIVAGIAFWGRIELTSVPTIGHLRLSTPL